MSYIADNWESFMAILNMIGLFVINARKANKK